MSTLKKAFKYVRSCDLRYTWDIRPKKERRAFVRFHIDFLTGK